MIQKTIIVGSVGKLYEPTYLPDERPVKSFNVACNYLRGDGKSITTWFTVSVLGDDALRLDEQLAVGDTVYCEGVLGVDPETGGPKQWVSKSTGQTLTKYELKAFIAKIIGGQNGQTVST